MANPSIPKAGARIFPVEETSTKRNPMTGPVHENETIARVRAMRKILAMPDVERLLELTLLPHDEGRVMSKPPRKLAAKTTRSKKKNMLKMALVERALSWFAPQIDVTTNPRPT